MIKNDALFIRIHHYVFGTKQGIEGIVLQFSTIF